MREKLVDRLREEVGQLSDEHQHDRLEKIATIYAAIQAWDFVQDNGGPKAQGPSMYETQGFTEV